MICTSRLANFKAQTLVLFEDPTNAYRERALIQLIQEPMPVE